MEARVVEGRDAAAVLMPRPVVLVGSVDADGAPDLSTVAWNLPLSYDPLLVGIAVKPTSTTLANIREAHAFTVSVIGPALEAAVDVCGSRHGDGAGKASQAGIELAAGEKVDVPHVDSALSWFECEAVDFVETGDHVLVVGRVALARTTCEPDDRGLMTSPDTLLCLQHGSYGVIA